MSNCSTEKAVPSDPQMTAAAMPVSPAAQENEPTLIDRDQHYKIKKLGFKASNEEAKTLLETAVKLDNAVARTDNKMLALGKGKSKHEYKKENKGKPEKEVAYSESTALGMYQIMHVFIGWALNNGKLMQGMKLKDLVPYVQDFLDEKCETCTANTVHTYVAMICKALGLNMKDYDYPQRRRADVIAHRGGLEDFCRLSAKYPELVRFCLATGLRKYKELGRLRGTDLRTEDDGFSVAVQGKGGLMRNAPVVGTPEEVALVVRLCREAGEGRVFPHLPANLDVHVWRAMYACRVYLLHARDVETLREEEKYECRADYRGIVLDIRAMEIASRALGHKRVSVIARSYLWPIVEFLRVGEQAEEPEQTADTIK